MFERLLRGTLIDREILSELTGIQQPERFEACQTLSNNAEAFLRIIGSLEQIGLNLRSAWIIFLKGLKGLCRSHLNAFEMLPSKGIQKQFYRPLKGNFL